MPRGASRCPGTAARLCRFTPPSSAERTKAGIRLADNRGVKSRRASKGTPAARRGRKARELGQRVRPAAWAGTSFGRSRVGENGEPRTARQQPEKGKAMLARIRKAREEREGGFTLIELLVVIIIIGILAAIAIPVFLNQRKKGYDAQVKADLRNAATAEETYLTDNPTAYTTDQNQLKTAGWKTSTGDTFVVAISSASNFCIVGNNSNSTHAFVYDSGSGGLNNQAYPGTDSATAMAAAKAGCTSITSPTWV